MARTALTREMVHGPIGCVATHAIRQAGVIEVHWQPGGGRVTIAALAGIVIGGFIVGVT